MHVSTEIITKSHRAKQSPQNSNNTKNFQQSQIKHLKLSILKSSWELGNFLNYSMDNFQQQRNQHLEHPQQQQKPTAKRKQVPGKGKT